jgi:4-amino-4-deoxy-L-arabinose transferase-like glycosyltransferase
MKEKYLILVTIAICLAIIFVVGLGRGFLGFGDDVYYKVMAEKTIENNWKIPYYIPEVYGTGDGLGLYLDKPPFSYYIPALFEKLGLFKLFSPLFLALSLLVIYYLGKKMYNERVGLTASLLVFSSKILVNFSINAYMETITMFFILLTVYFFYLTIEKKNKKHTILTGVFFGLALLSKQTAMIIPIVFLIFLIVTKNLKLFWKDYLIIITIGLLIFTPWLIRNYLFFKNPIFPLLPQLFGYAHLNTAYWQFVSTASPGQSIINNILDNFGILLVFLPVMIFYFHKNKMKRNELLLLLSFIIPLLLIYLPITSILTSIRAVIFVIAFISLFVATFISENKYYIYIIAMLCVVLIISVSYASYQVYGNTVGIPIRTQESYNWIINNTAENATLLDFNSMVTYYYTNRSTTYFNPYSGEELERWWDNESYAKDILKKNKIDYILFYTIFLEPDVYKHTTYPPIGKEFSEKVQNWQGINLEFLNEVVVIYHVK